MGKKGIALYGVGVNDSKTALSSLQNGLTAYDRWSQMLRRCYGDPGEYPTYSGCVVCDDWLLFSNYYSWFSKNYIPGFQVDKDLLIVGNKVYSPDTCLFVPNWLNSFIISCKSKRGKYPVGVSKLGKKYVAHCNDPSDGKREYLGLHESPDKAHQCWLKRKLEHAQNLKPHMDNIDIRIYPNVLEIIKAML
ncbi:hypothetical protein [Salmonella phage SW16-7]|nr:hypothetical protein [Salmonella phage SW16-7]